MGRTVFCGARSVVFDAHGQRRKDHKGSHVVLGTVEKRLRGLTVLTGLLCTHRRGAAQRKPQRPTQWPNTSGVRPASAPQDAT